MTQHPLFSLYDDTVEALKRSFAPGELLMILDVMNGTHLMGGLMGQQVGPNVEDSFSLYPGLYEDKWGVERAPLVEKLAGLDAWQRASLEVWASRFWQAVGVKPDLDPREYVAKGKHTAAGQLEALETTLGEAVDLMERTKHAFKSKTIEHAREKVEAARRALALL